MMLASGLLFAASTVNYSPASHLVAYEVKGIEPCFVRYVTDFNTSFFDSGKTDNYLYINISQRAVSGDLLKINAASGDTVEVSIYLDGTLVSSQITPSNSTTSYIVP